MFGNGVSAFAHDPALIATRPDIVGYKQAIRQEFGDVTVRILFVQGIQNNRAGLSIEFEIFYTDHGVRAPPVLGEGFLRRDIQADEEGYQA